MLLKSWVRLPCQLRHWGSIHIVTGKLGQTLKGCTDSKQSKSKHFLLQILAVIGRYGFHLMIVMIFVTQNNLKNGPVIPNHLLGFYLKD